MMNPIIQSLYDRKSCRIFEDMTHLIKQDIDIINVK